MCAYRRSEHIELFVFTSPQKVHVMHAYLLVMRVYRHGDIVLFVYASLQRVQAMASAKSPWRVRTTCRFMSVSIDDWKFSIRVATTVILA